MNTVIIPKQTLVITPQGENDLNQIYSELSFAINKTYNEKELSELLLSIIIESGKETFNSKKDALIALKDLARKVRDFSTEKFQSYKDNGVRESFNSDFNDVINYTDNTLRKLEYYRRTAPAKVKALSKEIPKNKEEIVEKLASGSMAILIFYISAGGFDLEGGIPDLDLKAGIGKHRHWISHSIFSGVIFEFTSRAILNSYGHIHGNLPPSRHHFWDKSKAFIDKNKNLAIGAMWAGVGAHLIKDSALITGGFKPYVGLPFEMSKTAHQGLFMANGLASSVFGVNSMTKDTSSQFREPSVIYDEPTLVRKPSVIYVEPTLVRKPSVIYVEPTLVRKPSVIYVEPTSVKLKIMFKNHDTKSIKLLLEEIGEHRYNECLNEANIENRPKSMKGFFLEAIDNKVTLCFQYPSKEIVRIVDVNGFINVPKTEWEFSKTHIISPD